jgi:hypothetical protein
MYTSVVVRRDRSTRDHLPPSYGLPKYILSALPSCVPQNILSTNTASMAKHPNKHQAVDDTQSPAKRRRKEVQELTESSSESSSDASSSSSNTSGTDSSDSSDSDSESSSSGESSSLPQDDDEEEENSPPSGVTIYTEQNPPEGALHWYWTQRHRLFSRYEEGIWMTNDSWFEVTPEKIAAYGFICPSTLFFPSF